MLVRQKIQPKSSINPAVKKMIIRPETGREDSQIIPIILILQWNQEKFLINKDQRSNSIDGFMKDPNAVKKVQPTVIS